MNPSYQPHNSLVSAFSRDILRNPYQPPLQNYGGLSFKEMAQSAKDAAQRTKDAAVNSAKSLKNSGNDYLQKVNDAKNAARYAAQEKAAALAQRAAENAEPLLSFNDILLGGDVLKKGAMYGLFALTFILILFLLINAKTKNKKFQIAIYIFLMLYLICYLLVAPMKLDTPSFEIIVNKILVFALLLYVFPSPIFTAHKSDDPWGDAMCGILLLLYLTFFATGLFNELIGTFYVESYSQLIYNPKYALPIFALILIPSIIYYFKKISKK